MPATYSLGKDYTVAGLAGATDLTVTRSAERVDVTTRAGTLPIKAVVAGLADLTFDCTVDATATTSFTIGKAYSVTVKSESLGSLICMKASREEPAANVIQYKLTLRPGVESDTANQVQIGPGTYRS